MPKRLDDARIVTKTIPAALIDDHPENYNHHPQAQIAKLKKSHEDFGQYRSIVVWERPGGRYVKVAGHGYSQGAIEDGATHFRCDVLPADTPPDVIAAIMAADNLHAQGSEPDQLALAQLLQEQADAGYDLAALGSSDAELAALLGSLTQAADAEWADAIGDLPDGDKSPFQQMTFTLTESQAARVSDALDAAKDHAPGFDTTGNANSNGNALAYIIDRFLVDKEADR